MFVVVKLPLDSGTDFKDSPEKVFLSVAKSSFIWALFGSSSSPFSYAFSASSGLERNEYAAPNRE